MARDMIRLSKSCLGEEEKKAVNNVLDLEFLGMGESVLEFEALLSSYFKRPVICVSTGTAALQLAIQALGIKKGDEILVPSITYVASFQAISANGAKPIPCDINLESLLIDLSDAEKRISSKTRAIMPVNYAGDPSDLSEVYDFASKFNLRVIQDSAHAFGSKLNNKLVGSFGDISCFSFDGIKNITSGEGGCVVTDDIDVINNIKDSRLLGVVNDSEKRYSEKRSWIFDVKNQGWRYHMSNIMAAIGIEQFKKMEFFSKKRKDLAKYYDRSLLNNREIIFFKRNYDDINPHIYVVRIPGLKDRDALIKLMNEYKIQIGIHYYPNHLLSYYNNIKTTLRNSEKLFQELITLPLHPDLLVEDVEEVVTKLVRAIKLIRH
jgi:dTDP-4-amino-4,6-dideoxygalactose transaminase